jgi:hypothetical protein
VLIVPPLAPVAPVKPPPPILIQGDVTFLNEPGIVVTKTRFMVHAQTFALANISSVSSRRIPARTGGFVLLFAVGALLALVGVGLVAAGFRPEEQTAVEQVTAELMGGVIMAFIGLGLSIMAIMYIRNAKDSFAVVLNTAGGEVKTCHSKDADFILRIVNALNDAIVSRG